MISTNVKAFDLNFILSNLSQTYWCKDMTIEILKSRINNAYCFGIFERNLQIGFARVVTDYITVAYIADVFIDKKHQGQGFGTDLINGILSDDKLNSVNLWLLGTGDAIEFYSKLGFKRITNQEKFMMINNT